MSSLTTSTLVTFLLLYLGPCHGYTLNYAITGICPSSQVPLSNLPLSNHDSYSSRFSQTLDDLKTTLSPEPLANCPLTFLLFSSILDSTAHHYNHSPATVLSLLAAVSRSANLAWEILVLYEFYILSFQGPHLSSCLLPEKVNN